MRNKEMKFFGYNLGMGIIFSFFSIFCASTLFYFLNWKISFINIFISVVMLVIYWGLLDRRFLKYYLIVFGGLIILALLISRYFIDFSGDGQSYQQMGVLQIALGWNPIKELIVPDVWDSTHSIWLNHFPRFFWIVSGAIYKVLGNLEMSKILNLLFIVSNFLVGYWYLRHKLINKKTSILVSGLVAFNPICVSQLNTFSVDTLIASLFGLLMWNIFIFIDKKVHIKGSDFSIFLISVILFNIKWPNLAYVFVLFVMILFYLYLRHKELIKRWIKIFVLAGIVGILLLGFDPYISNTVRYGNPFYPIYPSKFEVDNRTISPRFEVDGNVWRFMSAANSPSNFSGKSWWWKFWYSIFSVSSSAHLISYDSRVMDESVSELKVPFLIHKDEWLAFNYSDVRVAGFGVWFSGALILSLLILLALMLVNSKHFIELIFIWLMILIATWLNPESWWARYVPFLYFLPVLSFCWAFKENKRFLKALRGMLGVVLVVNTLLILWVVISFQWRMTGLRRNEIREMLSINQSQELPVVIDFITNGASRPLYFESGVSYVEARIESGIMENYFIKNMDKDSVELMKASYVLDDKVLEYSLKSGVSDNDLSKLAKIFNDMERVPLMRVKK